jgi:hypothetical protein
MTDVPIAFTVAVTVTEDGIMSGCFPTVDEVDEIQATRCRPGESVLGIFPLVLMMDEMELYMSEENLDSDRCRKIAARFFETGYRAGLKRGEDGMRQQLQPLVGKMLAQFEKIRSAREEVERVMSSTDKQD